MDTYAERYNLKPAAAWLRGHALKSGTPEIVDGIKNLNRNDATEQRWYPSMKV